MLAAMVAANPLDAKVQVNWWAATAALVPLGVETVLSTGPRR